MDKVKFCWLPPSNHIQAKKCSFLFTKIPLHVIGYSLLYHRFHAGHIQFNELQANNWTCCARSSEKIFCRHMSKESASNIFVQSSGYKIGCHSRSLALSQLRAELMLIHLGLWQTMLQVDKCSSWPLMFWWENLIDSCMASLNQNCRIYENSSIFSLANVQLKKPLNYSLKGLAFR